MNLGIFFILELCGIIGVALWFIGFCTLLVATRKARNEFRVKGYLRAPSGTRWFRFLLYKQYDAFDNPSTRFFFGITHFCLMGVLIVLMAVVVLLGSEVLLNGMSGFPGGGFVKPTL
jgi:hypothetical protein